ncbi:DNA mismatch repair protein [Mayamaea pseudoterrestris]|nr:DNA mismatch repair protein [Mayamaea pseudoterrestris]
MSIHILPAEVVNRIAAGEVIQKPSNAIKELIENCLDAGATSISITMEAVDCWTVSDNGKGMSPDDLQLAATRHATSKLSSTNDLHTLESFGFRGEALASMSMCSHLSIVSRHCDARVGYKQTYVNGAPCSDQPQPCARPPGTTVRMDQLFYNLPHRRKTNASSESYHQVLSMLQSYAILVAQNGTSIVCQKNGRNNTKVDLNSAAAVLHCNQHSSKEIKATATKQVLQQVYGSQMIPYLCEFESDMDETLAASANAKLDSDETTLRHQQCTYTCHGFVTSPSYTQNKKSTFILFCNQRLVECSFLKRAMESVYAEHSKAKPFIYWSLHVPPHQVDVNVHPTKRQVTLLHLNEISMHLQQALRALLQRQKQAFESQSVMQQSQQLKRKRDVEHENDNDDDESSVKGAATATSSVQTQLSYGQSVASSSQQSTASVSKLAPSKLIRTNRSFQHGSMEPFVKMTTTNPSQLHSQRFDKDSTSSESAELDSELQNEGATGANDATNNSADSQLHQPDCPLLATSTNGTADLNLPGAFAKVAASCTCRSNNSRIEVVDPLAVRVPPKQTYPSQLPRKIQPSECKLKSILSLRRGIYNQAADPAIVSQLRSSCLVGVVSHTRCILQCGADLVLLNYYDCACELFYQLSLLQFGALRVAKLGVPVDVTKVIGQFLELEDQLLHETEEEHFEHSITLLNVSETNKSVAAQAASFLMEKSAMLKEYFSIVVETNNAGCILLTGLPILLQGHAPSPHGVALFLLRLTTEVNFVKEKRCFQGISRELGLFYASVAATDESAWHSLVRHCLFPAVSTLLVPSRATAAESMKTVGNLSQLYKVFERC